MDKPVTSRKPARLAAREGKAARVDRDSRCAPEQSQESESRDSAARARGGHGRVGLGQVLAGVRHAVCRRPAALRRNLLAVRAAVPRSHGQAGGRSHRRHSARHRHRPDESGAHLALHRRHDDRAQRSPEAAVRARGNASLPQLRQAGAARQRGEHLRRRQRARGRGRRSARVRLFPGDGAEELQGSRSPRSCSNRRATRASTNATATRSKSCRTACASAAPTARASWSRWRRRCAWGAGA